MLENIPADETAQIEEIVDLTLKQLQIRYNNHGRRVLRGVHPKDHGCVKAIFQILDDLPDELQHGVFSEPGRQFNADVRFSNAAVLVTPDSPEQDGERTHGSRGMALKLHDVSGPRLVSDDGSSEQDFLLVNQPVFAFANVEDYLALSRALAADTATLASNPEAFFTRLPADLSSPGTPAEARAVKTLSIVKRIQALSTSAADFPAFQQPPASPVDNDYFSASPFLLGADRVMHFRARPFDRSTAEPDVSDDNYLRQALVERLQNHSAEDVVFHFEVQVREASSIDPDADIENASSGWPDTIPWLHVATLTIPPQEFDTAELKERCEQLVFSPWQGITAHQPLGGINRLRKAVYAASAKARA